jgi:hypothetical protein
MSMSVQLFFLAINALAYLVAPIALIWGWLRWSAKPKHRTVASFLSLIGFIFASASALVAISSVIYAHMINGFGFYDPRLMRILRWGVALSLGGLAFGIGGIWRSNSLRWHAPICALGTLAFWIGVAESQ